MHQIKKQFRIWAARNNQLLDKAITAVGLGLFSCFLAYITLGFFDLLEP